MKKLPKEYLGDGLYANFDGFQIELTAENGLNITDTVALEPSVYKRLREYAKAINKEYNLAYFEENDEAEKERLIKERNKYEDEASRLRYPDNTGR